MSVNGAVWRRVRCRLRVFPEGLAACAAEAAAYGRCVQTSTAPGGRLRKDCCAREFEALRSCFAAAHRRADGALPWKAGQRPSPQGSDQLRPLPHIHG
ncbi:NADH dehydrogenase [ubiquinone] 1 alpha subcomplex assembly factor 8 isoform X1 [Manis javanica]|uniref:NADH dehydrogenase [ubiquinone] 1 alpha subcomplex assembly factor 8 isoform X1 n=1 Tax=Manis javanica TaxID=9974 RepID=UPI003C6D2071